VAEVLRLRSVVYHFSATAFQVWMSRHTAAAAPALAVLGFMIRMTVIAVVLIVVGLWSPLSMIAVCLAFVGLFTVLGGWSLYRLMSKRHDAPPSAGAGGLT
jgi:hypothetical protein